MIMSLANHTQKKHGQYIEQSSHEVDHDECDVREAVQQQQRQRGSRLTLVHEATLANLVVNKMTAGAQVREY